MPHYVGISGPGWQATEANIKLAKQVGEVLANAGYIIVTGGLNGVMRAAAEGCKVAGGTSIGLLPADNRRAGSKAHTILLPTGLGEMRNMLLVHAVEALVVIGTGWGTISEVALAAQHKKPVIVLEGSGLPMGLPEKNVSELLSVLAEALQT